MKILVLNSGSSSIKFQFLMMESRTVLASGVLEQIGESRSRVAFSFLDASGEKREMHERVCVMDHQQGFSILSQWLEAVGVIENFNLLEGIGHRVVHGGETFKEPVLIDEAVMREIDRLSVLAPLHNPANLKGIEVAMQLAPDVPQIAIFDTAFHQSLPEEAYLYALPYKLYEEDGIRRYGFHGTSHHFVAKEAANYLKRPLEHLNLITLHLGNGSSVTAIKSGKSVDTSMGMTPLEGLIMGTRSGDIDPAIVLHLNREKGMTMETLDTLLNKQSGLKGISGSNDMREIIGMAAEGDEKAQLALDMFIYRIQKYVGAYTAVLGDVDAIVFTGGIGEHSGQVRELVCARLEKGFGVLIDKIKNRDPDDKSRSIHSSRSKMSILVIPTNEELEIALQAQRLLAKQVQ